MTQRSGLILILVLILPALSASAAPNYSFEGLLPRAETIFIGQVIRHTTDSATFEIGETLRGHTAQKTLKLWYSGYDDRRLAAIRRPFLVISQGDNLYGVPMTIISLGRYPKGQRGYRGWIAFPIKAADGPTYVDLIYTRVGQRPEDPSLKLTLAAARSLIQQVPYQPDGQSAKAYVLKAWQLDGDLGVYLWSLEEQKHDDSPGALYKSLNASALRSRIETLPEGTKITFRFFGGGDLRTSEAVSGKEFFEFISLCKAKGIIFDFTTVTN